MDIEKNKDIQVQKSSPEREEDAQQTDFVRITEKLTDVKVINRFNFQLRNSKTNEEKLSDLKVLSETPSPILNRFYSSPGLRTLGEWIYEGSDNITQNSEVLEKIFTLLKEIALKNEHFENAHYLGLGIEKMHIAQQNSEYNEALNIFYKFYNLNKSIINDWLESFKKRSQDPNFKRQQLWSEQQKLNVKRSFNTANNNNNMNKYPQKDYNQNKYNQGNNFQKGNNGKYGANNMQRGDSPPNQKKVKYNNGNAGSTGFNNNINLNQKPGAKSVRFSNADQIKRFRKEDEPIMPDLTEEEVEKYQEECIQKKQSDNHIFTSQDMKKRENKLEKESRNQQKESERKERQMLDEMKEDIQWRTPQKLKGLNTQYFEVLSSESTEKELHKQRILCKLQSLYGSDAEIPPTPSYENIINDKISEEQPKQVYLNKTDENDFIQVIEMAIKSENQQQQKQKVEKKVLKSILKISKEEKEQQRKKMIQEKKKQAEDEERLKSQINQNTFNLLIDLIMHNKNSRDELKQSVKDIGLSENDLKNIYQNINVIKKLWHQRQTVSTLSTTKYGSAAEEKKEQDKPAILPPPPPQNPHSQPPFNNNIINRPGSNSLTNNSNQQPVMNNSFSAPYNQHNTQNTTYNQYRSQQVNPQQNFSNNFNNNFLNNQPKQMMQGNNTFSAQQNNFGVSQRFQSNNMPSNNQHSFPPSHSHSQQGLEYNQQQKQDQNQQFHGGVQNQKFSQEQQNYYQHPQKNNNFNYNSNNNNNNNNNRSGPQTHRPNNQPSISQQNSSSNNQFYPQQNRNFNNNNQQQQQHYIEQNNYSLPNQTSVNNMQHQQKQPNEQFQQDQGYNNSLGQPSQMIQNKLFIPQKQQQNQQNKPNFNSNVLNQNNQKQIAPPNSSVAQHQNEESKTKHVPCRMYHSAMGCRYDVCNFLHNPEYQGRPVPNMQNKVRPMYALSKNGDRNLENTFEYNKANYEKRTGQLNSLPFPQASGISAPPPPQQFNQQQNNQFTNIPQVQQQSIRPQGQLQSQQNCMFIFQQTNPLLKQQQKPQPPQKI